jgi:excisionase family DNA binding protein
MTTLLEEPIGPVTPSQEDSAIARQASRQLAQLLDAAKEFRVQSRGEGKRGESVALPMPAVRLLVEILTQMAQGNTVTLIPIHAELTTQQAADLLNVSRPFLIKLLEQKRLPFSKVGKHRRIQLSDVLSFKHCSDEQRRVALERLAADGQELNMGY